MSVFISYSHVDKDFVKSLVKILAKQQIPYFLDSKDITWGSSINDEIRQAFDNAQYIIVVMSPASLKSSWVPYEVGLAKGKNVKILPILTHPSLDLPLYLADLKHFNSLNEVNQFLINNFHRTLKLGIMLNPGHATPIPDNPQQENEKYHYSSVGISRLSIDEISIPEDKLPYLGVIVTNNEFREIELVQATIEFTEEIRLNSETEQGYSALFERLERNIFLRPGGEVEMNLPVEFNAVIDAFCSGKVSGVCVEDIQNFKCFASNEDISEASNYFKKFFHHIDVDQLKKRYHDY